MSVWIIVKSPYKRLLFVVNRAKDKADALAARLSETAQAAGFDVRAVSDHPPAESVFENADLCCVIGGDGTILGCLAGATKHGVPIFGINLGKLGFMATFTDSISDAEFLDAIGGKSETEERALLKADYGHGYVAALNEIVIKSANIAGIARLEVKADGEFVANFVGDGLIFSTPTGSTAYNLSANGPLLHPSTNAFVLTSICPHTLSNRSIVFGGESKIEAAGKDCILIADGKIVSADTQNLAVKISVHPSAVKFLRAPGRSHFSVLRTKLGWANHPGKNEAF